jgi:polyhydroxyalkanoate synthesis repressor PhaR
MSRARTKLLQGDRNAGSAAPARTIFKKYGKNRRLYDTSASRYVNLEEMAGLIRQGKEIQVVDAKTGEDLTRVTLMQIIMEDARDKPTVLPVELLRHLIVASDHAGREFITWYMHSAFDTYRKVQSALESGLSEVQSAAKSPLQLVKSFLQSTVSPKPAEDPELQELRNRVAELEARLEASKKRVPSKGKTG